MSRLILAGVVVLAAMTVSSGVSAAVEPPPPGAGFDYQLGGGYAPPDGVEVVSRDHTDDPAEGVYNICYVNAFQAQPGAEDEWGDLLLRDENGEVVHDGDWGEAILDIRTDDKRRGIADKVNGWIDDCADKGFDGVEPDNYDTFTRYPDLLDADDAQAMIRLLSAHAHERGLAIAQKNTVELAGDRAENGLDFAVAEECGFHDECDGYADAFDGHVVVIEYTAGGLTRACAGWRDELSIVRRDEYVVRPGADGYLYDTC